MFISNVITLLANVQVYQYKIGMLVLFGLSRDGTVDCSDNCDDRKLHILYASL